MRNLTWAQHAVAGLKMEALRANLNDVVAFQRIKEFILIVVKVTRRASFLLIRQF